MAIKTEVTKYLRRAHKATTTKLKPLTKNFQYFVAILALLAAAQLVLFFSPLVGVYINAVAFAALVGLALWQEKIRQLAISAAILPVANMVNLSLPQTTAFAQAVVFYDTILVLALIYRFTFTLDYPLASTQLTRRGYATILPLMVVAGQLLGVVGYGLLRHQYPYDHTSLPLVAATAVVFAVAEESLFRGLIQQRASVIFDPKVAAVLSATLYTLFTFGHTGSWLSPFVGLIMGVVLSFTYYKKQNLILTITINAVAKLTFVGLIASFIFR